MCIKSWDIKGILRQKDSGEIDAFASLFVLRMVHHTHVWKMAGRKICSRRWGLLYVRRRRLAADLDVAQLGHPGCQQVIWRRRASWMHWSVQKCSKLKHVSRKWYNNIYSMYRKKNRTHASFHGHLYCNCLKVNRRYTCCLLNLCRS